MRGGTARSARSARHHRPAEPRSEHRHAERAAGGAGSRPTSCRPRSTRNEDLQTSITASLSNTEDTNVAKASIAYANEQAAYEAALRAGATIVQESCSTSCSRRTPRRTASCPSHSRASVSAPSRSRAGRDRVPVRADRPRGLALHAARSQPGHGLPVAARDRRSRAGAAGRQPLQFFSDVRARDRARGPRAHGHRGRRRARCCT